MNNRLHSLKILGVSLVFALTVFGCASNRNISQNDTIELTAKNAPQGVLLSFSHIPPETTRLFVHLTRVTEDGFIMEPIFADIRGSLLNQVKETRTLVCPFVLAGHNYKIGVSVEKDGNHKHPSWLFAEVFVENNGIHVLNDLALELNNTQTGVTLSAAPVFSSMVQFSYDKYSYRVTVMLDDNMSISYGGNAGDALMWDFSSFFTSLADVDIPSNVNITGSFPAHVTVFGNLNYENITWYVGIARSDEFIIYL